MHSLNNDGLVAVVVPDITVTIIASIDDSGNDTGHLSMTTDSLDFTHLTETHYSTDSSSSQRHLAGIESQTPLLGYLSLICNNFVAFNVSKTLLNKL